MVTISILGFSYSFSQLFLLNCFFGTILFICVVMSLYEYFWGIDEWVIPYLLIMCFVLFGALLDINHIVVVTVEGC